MIGAGDKLRKRWIEEIEVSFAVPGVALINKRRVIRQERICWAADGYQSRRSHHQE